MKGLKQVMGSLGLIALALLLVSCGEPRALRPLRDFYYAGLAFSPDGSALVLASESSSKGEIQLELREWPSLKRRWRVEVGENYGSISNPVAFSLDGKELALITRNRLLRYSIGGELIKEILLQDDPRIAADDIPLAVDYVPDGSLAVLVDREAAVFVVRYDREGNPLGDLIPVGDEDWIAWSRPFSADGRFLAYVKDFHIVGLLDLASGEAREWDLLEELGVSPSRDWLRTIWGVAVHPQGKEIALGLHVDAPGLPRVMRFDADSGEVIEEFLPSEREDDYICSLTYSRDGSLLAAQACPSPPSESALFLHPLATGELNLVCESDEDKYCFALHVSFSPRARYLLLQRGDRVTFVEAPEVA